MLDRMPKNSLLDSKTNAIASREHDRTQTILLDPRQKESLEILNDLLDEEFEPKADNPKFTVVS